MTFAQGDSAVSALHESTLPLRRNRDFALLFASQIVSTLGTRATGVAFPLLVLGLTGSPFRAGLVGFAQTLPFLVFALPAGALVDRLDRKRLMIVSDAGRALALGSMPLAYVFDALTFTQIVCVAFVEGMFFILFDFAQGAAVPQVVDRAQLPTAIALNQARTQGADMIGAPLGGGLFGLHRMAPFLADFLSYAVSFIALSLIRTPLQQPREAKNASILSEIREGVSWLWRQRFLRTCVFLVSGTNLVSNALTLVLIVRARDLGASPVLIGVMLGFYGIGALVASTISPTIIRRVPSKLIVIGSMWLWAGSVALLAIPREPLLLGTIVGVTAAPLVVWNVVLGSYRYALAPDRLLGRVQSAGRLIAWSTIPIAPLTAGLLLESIGALNSILVLAALMGVVATIGSLVPSVRHAPPLETLSTPEIRGRSSEN